MTDHISTRAELYDAVAAIEHTLWDIVNDVEDSGNPELDPFKKELNVLKERTRELAKLIVYLH